MRERLSQLLEHAIAVTPPDEEFFSAGPLAAPPQPLHRERRHALLADLRKARSRHRDRQAA